ncbi:hypothetical protein V8J88_03930 [Massilia sp. W12]|uniref:hypothetical protein n=1 Tax=Massilia sp. W12 TaxID=3126507 RepID=UPI0030CA7EE9
MNDTWNDRLNLLLDERSHTSQRAFADAIGVSNPSVTGYRSGDTKTVAHDIFLRIAKYFSVCPHWLAGDDSLCKDGGTPVANVHIDIASLIAKQASKQPSSTVLFVAMLDFFSSLSSEQREFIEAYLSSSDVARTMALTLLKANKEGARESETNQLISAFEKIQKQAKK